MHGVHAIISGRVQGVGFRHFVAESAARLGVSGWVRNQPDGTVELEAEGSRAQLLQLIDACRRGPPSAGVRHLSEEWFEREPRYGSFGLGG